MWIQRERPSFDDQPLLNAALEDLDPDRVGWYLARAADERGLPVDHSLLVEEKVTRLNAVFNHGNKLVPRITGVLLFGRAPQQFVPQSEVRLARFQGTAPVNFINRLGCRGTLPEMIDEGGRFVKRNTRVAAKVVGFERQEITPYSYSASREALTNAVTHRGYWRGGTEEGISLFADPIKVQSLRQLTPTDPSILFGAAARPEHRPRRLPPLPRRTPECAADIGWFQDAPRTDARPRSRTASAPERWRTSAIHAFRSERA